MLSAVRIANAESEHENGNGGKARISCELTHREFDIAEQIVEPDHAASEIEAFLRRLHVAELERALRPRGRGDRRCHRQGRGEQEVGLADGARAGRSSIW